MEELSPPSEAVLRSAIMSLEEPVLFQGILKDATGAYTWELLKWKLADLSEKFGDLQLPFRVGHNKATTGPQWEINCSTMYMTLSEFIEKLDSNVDSKEWYYFDYKYMHEWFKDKSDILNSLNWSRFGFDKSGSDSTLWIGSKGAHTNCHQDSYGCNLVAQIHGRKQWLLFPPDSSNFLQPSRIPYEESTVYSKFNFFCPKKKDETAVLKMPKKPRLIVLEPGDVLFVPGGWWHYVESLDLSISVNIWLPMDTDSQSRVKEAIVQLIVATIGQEVCAGLEVADCGLPYCMKLLDAAMNEFKKDNDVEPPCEKKARYIDWTAKDLATKYPNYVKLINELRTNELEDLLKQKRDRFPTYSDKLLESDLTVKSCNTENTFTLNPQLPQNVINALCHPDVINKVTDLLLNS